MKEQQSLSHTVWDCKYHIVWILKYSVAQVVVFIKEKSAISIARNYVGRRKNFTGQKFWVRGYHVSTVCKDEEVIKNYIRHQENEDRRRSRRLPSWDFKL